MAKLNRTIRHVKRTYYPELKLFPTLGLYVGDKGDNGTIQSILIPPALPIIQRKPKKDNYYLFGLILIGFPDLYQDFPDRALEGVIGHELSEGMLILNPDTRQLSEDERERKADLDVLKRGDLGLKYLAFHKMMEEGYKARIIRGLSTAEMEKELGVQPNTTPPTSSAPSHQP